MVEVYIVKEDGLDYYSDLSGRWYIGPTGWLWLEVTWEEWPFWPFKTTYFDFVREDEVRELCGDYCA